MGNALPLFFTVLTALCLALVFIALWRSLRTLLGEPLTTVDSAVSASDRQVLLIEKQSLLQSLRDLEQERDMGKVSQDDFDAINNRLRARAREVLKQLDAQVSPFRDKAESLVQQVAATPVTKRQPQAEVAAATTEVKEASSPACGKCATTNEADAVFCKKCGHKLADGAQAS